MLMQLKPPSQSPSLQHQRRQARGPSAQVVPSGQLPATAGPHEAPSVRSVLKPAQASGEPPPGDPQSEELASHPAPENGSQPTGPSTPQKAGRYVPACSVHSPSAPSPIVSWQLVPGSTQSELPQQYARQSPDVAVPVVSQRSPAAQAGPVARSHA